MKPTLALASLLLAAVFPLSSGAIPEPLVGKSAPVTLQFTLTYQTGGFTNTHKKSDPSNSNITRDDARKFIELSKTIINSPSYNRRQFIIDYLKDKYQDEIFNLKIAFQIIYMEINDPHGPHRVRDIPSLISRKDLRSIRGFFLVGNGLPEYLGGFDDPGFPINLVSTNVSAYDEFSTHQNDRIDGMDINSKDTGHYQSTTSYTLTFKPTSTGNAFIAHGLLNERGAYNIYEDYINSDNSSNSYTGGMTTLDNLVGDDGDGIILTGSMTWGAPRRVKDVSEYVAAYDAAHAP